MPTKRKNTTREDVKFDPVLGTNEQRVRAVFSNCKEKRVIYTFLELFMTPFYIATSPKIKANLLLDIYSMSFIIEDKELSKIIRKRITDEMRDIILENSDLSDAGALYYTLNYFQIKRKEKSPTFRMFFNEIGIEFLEGRYEDPRYFCVTFKRIIDNLEDEEIIDFKEVDFWMGQIETEIFSSKLNKGLFTNLLNEFPRELIIRFLHLEHSFYISELKNIQKQLLDLVKMKEELYKELSKEYNLEEIEKKLEIK